MVDLSAGTDQVSDDGLSGGVDQLSGIENIEGSDQDDDITGSGVDNILNGEGGADKLSGGLGNDIFSYENESDSDGTTYLDEITDFNAGTGDGVTITDQIDLSHLVSGSFTFESGSSFNVGNASAFFNNSTKILEIDTDNDQLKDMEIKLTNTHIDTLDDSDFIIG
jgi:Ca2+-binding RTX toxin-like protein